MNWFKMIWLNSDEREILRQAKNKPAPTPEPEEEPTGRPYRKLYYSNKNITVIFNDGTMVSKPNVSFQTFTQVRDAKTETQIEDLLIDKVQFEPPMDKENRVETQEERQLVSSNLDVFKDKSDFEVRGTDVYLKGVNLPMPAPVIASFIELIEKEEGAMKQGANRDVVDAYYEQRNALKMFWLKLALNTLPQSREDLLIFVRKNDVRITRNGNLILYRRIVTKAGADTKLVTDVTQEYYKIKKQGLDPREFAVVATDKGYTACHLESPDIPESQHLIGNLQVMYLELPTYDTNSFTSAHDRKVEIKLGGIYKIADDKINLDNGICAAGGLHAAAVDYNYSGFGDMPVVVLVNPSKAITVPMGETGKLRTTEMFVACVNDKPQGVHFDESALSAFDSEYHDLTLSELEEAAKSKSFDTLSIQDNVPAISLADLNTIRNMLKDRVKVI